MAWLPTPTSSQQSLPLVIDSQADLFYLQTLLSVPCLSTALAPFATRWMPACFQTPQLRQPLLHFHRGWEMGGWSLFYSVLFEIKFLSVAGWS